MSAELLSMWTDLLRERTRLVDDAYSSLKSVRLEAVPDLGPSSSPARAVLQGLESDIPDCALVVDTIASSMIAAANIWLFIVECGWRCLGLVHGAEKGGEKGKQFGEWGANEVDQSITRFLFGQRKGDS
ncbi:hypothetical protein [Schaalia cardiffensis]|uniref:hypothetical protein n=1 Tax=Schaalia cardiffensis TaxID=181487 RepID=UPI0023F07781|nr:hypothetical protein [Schaalia cardiffensis]